MLAAAEHHEMIECPDLFRLNGQDVLLYCLQRRDNAVDQVISAHSAYRLVDFDTRTGTISKIDLEHGYETLDAGFCTFFAPQTFEAPDGRRLLLAWMSRMDDGQERVFAEGEPRIHCMTASARASHTEGQALAKTGKGAVPASGGRIGVERHRAPFYPAGHQGISSAYGRGALPCGPPCGAGRSLPFLGRRPICFQPQKLGRGPMKPAAAHWNGWTAWKSGRIRPVLKFS